MKLTALPLFLSTLLIPFPVSAALEQMFLYFPESRLLTTPAAMQLEFEDVFFSAADGTKLHGWYIHGEAGKPVIVFCHGNAGNISHRVYNLRRFRDLGLSVFIFDYRGYGQSEGKTTEIGSYDDMRGAIDWLKSRGWQVEQMIYFGRSLGAGVALQLALELPPAGLVLESAFTSIKAMGQKHYPLLWLLAGWALDARYDNLTKIGQLQAPLLIFHGERDDIVPISMGKELFDAAPQPKSFYPIARAGHNDTYDRGGQEYWQQWQEFLLKVNSD